MQIEYNTNTRIVCADFARTLERDSYTHDKWLQQYTVWRVGLCFSPGACDRCLRCAELQNYACSDTSPWDEFYGP